MIGIIIHYTFSHCANLFHILLETLIEPPLRTPVGPRTLCVLLRVMRDYIGIQEGKNVTLSFNFIGSSSKSEARSFEISSEKCEVREN